MNRRASSRALASLLASVVFAFAAGAIGAVGSLDAPTFYAQLDKPAWAPPARIFGPVWTLLYAMMGVAAWLVWRAPGPRTPVLVLFGVQLAANALWSWLFFAWRSGPAATAEVLVLVALVVATVVAFWRRSRLAGLLLLPYLGWVSFAFALTWTVWQRNSGLL